MNLKKILIDTDIGPDCDDVAALAMLNLYADKGLCEILGIGHCTSNPYGAGTIDAINRFYSRPNIEIGTFSGKGFLTDENCMKYNKYMTLNLPNRYRNSQPEDVVKMYRRILSIQEKSSIEFIAIGPLNNLSNLLNSEPDEFSTLDGLSLVREKVTRLVLMAGIFPTTDKYKSALVKEITGNEISNILEFNVVKDISAAQNVADNWPTPKVYIGFEAGLIFTGKSLLNETIPENHPVRLAYHLYTDNGERYSWDLLTIEYAIISGCSHYKPSPMGKVSFDNFGKTFWVEDENGVDCFVEWAQPSEVIADDINRLLAMPPNTGF